MYRIIQVDKKIDHKFSMLMDIIYEIYKTRYYKQIDIQITGKLNICTLFQCPILFSGPSSYIYKIDKQIENELERQISRCIDGWRNIKIDNITLYTPNIFTLSSMINTFQRTKFLYR